MRTKLSLLLFALAALIYGDLFAQGVSVNTNGTQADANAMLDVSSSTKGVLISRLTTTERNTLGALSPATGMLVFDTDSLAFYYYSSGWIKLAGGSLIANTNEVIITQPLILTGDAVVFDDFRVPASSAKSGGAGVPPFSQVSALGDVFQYHFEDVSQAQNEQSLYFNIQMPHNWENGSTIYPHVHWIPSSTGTGTVRWGLEYTWVNINGTFGPTTTIYGQETITNASNKHLMTFLNSSSMTATGRESSSMIMCRIFRNSSSGIDTYTGSAILLEFDFHYQVDKLGDVYTP